VICCPSRVQQSPEEVVHTETVEIMEFEKLPGRVFSITENS
jgi:hypothetical protein